MFWPQERWRRASAACQSLTVFSGGPHSSEPSFRRAAVQPGGLLYPVYPVGVRDQVLYVFGRMRVQEVISLEGDDRQSRLSHYFARYRGWRFLAPTCTSEVVIGSEGTGIAHARHDKVQKKAAVQPSKVSLAASSSRSAR